ncbi:M20/M25/M40 family metallo-hydrolase [Cetobacterium sp. 8H]|uniref:M42 family metallopeptidase n=1 Tax=Cetobacterium sp. 8H TaxID=2759681 RepID=UPI00163CAD26|nr:M20/M25/M40 family metallo-hydrolase [Cetobacterium sp. 8H]MBC2851959.1 M20/M25/M40 family metallo-hydrolase [Cetobacterium sp. 8H]
MNKIKLLEELSNLHGAPGHEIDVVEFIKNSMNDFNCKRDSINNLYIKRNDMIDGPIVALDCHSDEVGFIVENINSNGTISFLPLGGWHITNIPAHSVVIKNFKGEYIKGVVASKPPHFMTAEEKQKLPKLDELVIDIGTSSFEETVNLYGIEVGNPITPDVTFSYDPKIEVVRGKAFDNRLGCAIVMEIMKETNNIHLNVNPIGVVSSQEEVGLRGAQVAANTIKPDFAIIFEGSPADDTFKDAFSSKGAIGKGVQLRVIDAGMVSNPRVQEFVKNIARNNNIPFQVIARSGGSTNGGKYHIADKSIPTVVIGIPTRYIHTHYTYASIKDYENAILLGRKLLEALTVDIINKF